MKNRTSLCILFLLLSLSFLGAQNSPFYFSAGVLRSDLHEGWVGAVDGPDVNETKTGYLLSLGRYQQIWRNAYLDVSINYQERWPLEVFAFSESVEDGINGILFGGIPSSPQSRGWDPEIYERLPNFKYLHLEIIPTYIIGSRLQARLGVGIFAGRLLNQQQLVLDKEDFPSFEFFFGPPFNTQGTDSYQKYDFGWIPKVSVSYSVNQKLSVGLSAKAYFSEFGLKEKSERTTRPWGRNWYNTWQVFTLGADVIYNFGN